MKNSLLFDFTVDKTANTVFITREFAAELSLVWDAFTTKEILDQWGAPEPWTAKTKHMNFEVGGRRFYSMCSPEGQEHWSIQDYTSISPKTNFKYISGFSDKAENIDPEFYGSENDLDFSEAHGTDNYRVTTVRQTIKYKTPAILEMMIAKGFREGVTMTLNNLENLLTNLTQQGHHQTGF